MGAEVAEHQASRGRASISNIIAGLFRPLRAGGTSDLPGWTVRAPQVKFPLNWNVLHTSSGER